FVSFFICLTVGLALIGLATWLYKRAKYLSTMFCSMGWSLTEIALGMSMNMAVPPRGIGQKTRQLRATKHLKIGTTWKSMNVRSGY
ncbi:MAG: hypothetical protein PVF65_10735, partial [Sphingomonadales bacterium]